jgi:alkylhydroperoxidase/carboxymuconolactone decarboxylase family protein YurZ
MNELVGLLKGGDRRSIGASNQVVRKVLADRHLLAELIHGLTVDDLLVRMRCADAAEKVSCIHPVWLQPHKKALLDLARHTTQQELRWHLAQMLPRLTLTSRERSLVQIVMRAYLNDRSRIVQAFALQALADLAAGDLSQQERLVALLEATMRHGSPATRARARHLPARLHESVPGRSNRSTTAAVTAARL